MQSIFGALLTAGYASAAAAAISSAPNNEQINDEVQSQLTKSFAGAEATAEQYPDYANAITSAAKEAFLQGDQWAYFVGVIAILLGAALVYFFFPKKEREDELLRQYHAEDMPQAESAQPEPEEAAPTAQPIPSPAP